jgi:hypothetical protein
MARDQISTELWLTAGLNRCSKQGTPATVIRRGESQSGTVVLKINQFEDGCRILTQGRDNNGKLIWLPALNDTLVEESVADSYLERTANRDPDIWIIEIENRSGWHPFQSGLF